MVVIVLSISMIDHGNILVISPMRPGCATDVRMLACFQSWHLFGVTHYYFHYRMRNLINKAVGA